jgi:hypothetical protein
MSDGLQIIGGGYKYKSHPTPSMMSSLASDAIEAIDFAVGLIKQLPWPHKDGVMVGWGFSSAQDVITF